MGASKSKLSAAAWMNRHFPNYKAREAADEAIDEISVDQPMHVFLDAWIAAYKKAGGKVDFES